jgi:acetyl esterase/lipase
VKTKNYGIKEGSEMKKNKIQIIGIVFLLCFGMFCAIASGKWKQLDTSFVKQKWTDLVYATVSERQKLDIYLPNSGKAPFPVIMYIHGGAFLEGNKSVPSLEPVLKAGLEKEYAVVSVNYRLSTEAKWPACVTDIKAAIRWVRANAKQYSLDGDRIVAWGASAGGHLAAMTGTSGRVKEFTDPALGNTDQSDQVQAVVDCFGPINFLTMNEQFKKSGVSDQDNTTEDSVETKLFGKKITAIPDTVRKSNPETYITPDDPPFFIQHGTKDKLIPVEQSQEFAKKLGKIIGEDKVVLKIFEGAGHGDGFSSGTPVFTSPESFKEIFDFLDKELKQEN